MTLGLIGNGGTANDGKCQNINIKADDFSGLLEFAKKNEVRHYIVELEEEGQS